MPPNLWLTYHLNPSIFPPVTNQESLPLILAKTSLPFSLWTLFPLLPHFSLLTILVPSYQHLEMLKSLSTLNFLPCIQLIQSFLFSPTIPCWVLLTISSHSSVLAALCPASLTCLLVRTAETCLWLNSGRLLQFWSWWGYWLFCLLPLLRPQSPQLLWHTQSPFHTFSHVTMTLEALHYALKIFA